MERKFWKHISADKKVLEIWTGLWNFANFCVHKNIKEYTGIEIDKSIAEKLWKHFNTYKIVDTDALQFFENTDEKFDIIFLSHVFEHFTIEEGISLAKQISKHLAPKGMRINIMPNAWCISCWVARYNDITHKVIYTSNSFNQVLLEAGFHLWEIQHFNVLPRNIIKKAFFRLAGLFLSIHYNTFELMTIIQHKI
jgi:2-polyprenyl-3-methyl-5-hydroxy-6-metoxy-1,4-benzoquinol methylase